MIITEKQVRALQSIFDELDDTVKDSKKWYKSDLVDTMRSESLRGREILERLVRDNGEFFL